MAKTVSVNVCCYNGERYLEEALDSVVAQTFKDWELVIVDDGSVDSSSAIIRRYQSAGWPIVYHWQENAGLGNARRKCVELSSGRYIGFLDQDDVWLPDKLERQVEAMADGTAALCFGGIIEIDGVGRRIGEYVPKKKSGEMFGELLFDFDVHLPTAFIRKEALEASRLTFDGKVSASEEYCLFMQLAVNNRFAVIPDVIAKYRIHDEALTNKSIARWADEREYTLGLIRQAHPGIERRYESGFREAYARARYYRARYRVYQGDRRAAREEMIKNVFIDARYFFLFVLLFLPAAAWNWIHLIRSRRTRYGTGPTPS